MREIVVDTETTGLEPQAGHRVVEIGCVELVDRVPTGRTWQTYLNPDRDVPAAAFEVHGLKAEFLATKPRFTEVVHDFLAFLGDATLVMHNAEFDRAFLNAELERVGAPQLSTARLVDTLELARRKYPGAAASLDALCRRFSIDAQDRSKYGGHGALLDAQLLAQVYLRLAPARQQGLALVNRAAADGAAGNPAAPRPPRPHGATGVEAAAHAAFVHTALKSPIWRS